MGGGGKGGSRNTTSETRVRLDPRMEEGAAQGIAAALRSASLPYTPNRGIQIAGFAPQELAAMESADDAASAFGFGAGGTDYLPPTLMSDSGFTGYSPALLYDEMLEQSVLDEDLAARNDLLLSYAQAADRVSPRSGFSSRVASAIGTPTPASTTPAIVRAATTAPRPRTAEYGGVRNGGDR